MGTISGHIPEKRRCGVAPPVALEVLVYLFAEAVIVALPDRSRVMTFTIHTAVLSPGAMLGALHGRHSVSLTHMPKPQWPKLVAVIAVVSLAAAEHPEAPAIGKYLTRPTFRWTCEGNSTFRFCYPPGFESVVIDVKRGARQSLAKTLRLAGTSTYTARPLIYIFVLESEGRLRELIHVGAYGASEPKDHAVFFVWSHPEALTHELNHEVLATLWGPAEQWIAEGFAAYAAEPAVDMQCRTIFDNHGYLPLANMIDPEWTASMYPAGKIYPELGSFVKYLHQTYGIARLRQVWHRGSRSIPRVFGKPLLQLEHEWQASLYPPIDPDSIPARPRARR